MRSGRTLCLRSSGAHGPEGTAPGPSPGEAAAPTGQHRPGAWRPAAWLPPRVVLPRPSVGTRYRLKEGWAPHALRAPRQLTCSQPGTSLSAGLSWCGPSATGTCWPSSHSSTLSSLLEPGHGQAGSDAQCVVREPISQPGRLRLRAPTETSARSPSELHSLCGSQLRLHQAWGHGSTRLGLPAVPSPGFLREGSEEPG